MYIIRAVKANTNEFSDIARFRSQIKAKETLMQISAELHENLPSGDRIQVFMGINQFTHFPKKGSPVVYFITFD